MTVYLDCTTTRRSLLQTGIQRVVRNVVYHAREAGQRRGVDIVPVYLGAAGFQRAELAQDGALVLHTPSATVIGWTLRAKRVCWQMLRGVGRMLPASWRQWLLMPASQPGFARLVRRSLHRLGVRQPQYWRVDSTPVLVFNAQDTVVALDLVLDAALPQVLERARSQGASIVCVCYDLIPFQYPEGLPHTFTAAFRVWMDRVLARSDRVITISRSVARDVNAFLAQAGSSPAAPVPITTFRLGHDFVAAGTQGAVSAAFAALFPAMRDYPVFLSVGWIDTRKNQQVLVDALLLLHQQGIGARLVMVGKRGPAAAELLQRIRRDPLLARAVTLCDDASDAEVDHAYRHCDALVYPSLVEGFGLPLVEALTRGAKVFASDIPVFHEVASGHVVYFDPHDPVALAQRLRSFWLERTYPALPQVADFRWPDWRESTGELLDRVLERQVPP